MHRNPKWTLASLLVFVGFSILLLLLIRLNSVGSFVKVPISEIMSGKPIALPQDDRRIIDYIWRTKLLHPPSKDKYNLKQPDIDPSSGQGQYIQKLLSNMTKGFFIECGALDGETRSNTLYLEKALLWTGLLIEADPINFELMKKKNRKAWLSSTCLAVKPYPHTATFLQSHSVGRIVNEEDSGITVGTEKYVTAQCLPLFSLLTALNVSTVDYFSLDVEGAELQILRTIPFQKVFIRTLSVEIAHTLEGKDELLKFMESQEYRMHGKVEVAWRRKERKFANDFIFVHKNAFVES